MTRPPSWSAGRSIPEMPEKAWPAADRRALRPAAGQRRSPFAAKHAVKNGDTGPSMWRPATRRNVNKAYGKWLSFLNAIESDVLAEPPADRVTESRCEAFVDALAASGLAASSQGAYLYHLAMAAKALAPREDWTWLVDTGLRMRHAAAPVRDKRSRTVSAADLYALGISLMEDGARTDGHRRATLRYRDGMILALWAARPWRLRTFAALDFDTHLQMHGERAASVVLEVEDVKTTAAQEWPLPAHLVPYLRTYLERYRACLPGAERHAGFWPSMKGGRLREDGLARVLARHTERAFGTAVHPHAVRYAAATSTALAGPRSAGTIMSVLGHADPSTASDYYVLARSIEAQRKATSALQRTKAALQSRTS